MLKYNNLSGSVRAAVYEPDGFIVKDAEDILGIIAEAGMNECNGIIMDSESFDPRFFDLKTGIAGEILQKFSNYRMKLVLTGDFSNFASNSLRDFIRECNRGNTIRFLPDADEGMRWLQAVLKR
jgi:hypothetical protein